MTIPTSKQVNRRSFLRTTSTIAGVLIMPNLVSATSFVSEKRMGVAVTSYVIRWRSKDASKRIPGFVNALDFLDHCHQLGAGGAQVGVRNWTQDFAGKVRDQREKLGLYLEGQILLPKDSNDVDRFESEVKGAKEAGATILRTVCLLGRRYENFKTMESFLEFKKASIRSLELAEPVVRKHQIKLAIENHKDWRIPEMLELLKHLKSEWMGVTLDTGNSISLLEDPMAVVEAFAPYTFTIHFKDMAFEDYEDGFLLSEVPLGMGALDLKKIVEICRKHNPEVTFNLEMITRDPLKIPCLKDDYWATFDALSGKEFAKTLQMIRQHPYGPPLPRINQRSPEERLDFEESNVRESFEYAKKELGFA